MAPRTRASASSTPAKHIPTTPTSTSTSTALDTFPREPLLGTSLSQRQNPSSPSTSPTTTTSIELVGKQDTRGIEQDDMEFKDLSRKSQWIALAIMSGACAAFNGVFAKLTTTELTTSFATSVANLLGLGDGEKVVEVAVRGLFFLLNLLFNAIMWTLFTKALARGTSTTRVSILNTSANFMLTAILGFLIFSESLPPLWFLGAALLVAGNVIIGRRDEGEDKDGAGDLEGGEREEEEGALLVAGGEELELELEGAEGRKDEDVVQLGDLAGDEIGDSDDNDLVDLRSR
ncbi:hypothetical protein LOCC1_G003022 [Lachnellula occidentalis]|uniref:Transmembrane protein 42 n=1 Tax=Lachnellula occidentalis TaxID=215460 RepID=A0A8H8UF80_9HELO|nr:hypothetical protein LOCC1_G003022 [Lachnellula occidentalis]